MALKQYKPTSPARRGLILVDKSQLWKGKPVKSLTEGKTKTGGRNNKGKSKRWKGKPYQRSDFKKAIVTLAEGQTIDVTSGI